MKCHHTVWLPGGFVSLLCAERRRSGMPLSSGLIGFSGRIAGGLGHGKKLVLPKWRYSKKSIAYKSLFYIHLLYSQIEYTY
jgi:hypothetical protein